MCQYLTIPLEPLLRVPPASEHALRCCCCPLGSKKSREVCQGNHLFNCRQEQTFTKRHNAIMDVVAKAFRSVHIIPEVERTVQAVAKIGNNNNRLSLKRYDISGAAADSDSKTLCLDVAVTSHVTNEYLKYAVNKPLYNMVNMITTKRRKYFAHVQHETEVFIPLICETSGAIHSNFQRLYEHLAIRANGAPPTQANWAAPTFASYWMQRTSVVLWRETMRSLQRLAAKSARLSGFNRGAAEVPADMVIQELGPRVAQRLAAAPEQQDDDEDVQNIDDAHPQGLAPSP